jgi:uncharacterized membrane protein
MPADTKSTFELVIGVFESAGVAVLVLGSVLSAIIYARALFLLRTRLQSAPSPFVALRQNLGRTILLGLELLVIADIIHSVAIDLSLPSVATLGLLILVRTFLSWSLEVEIDGEWPWQRARTGNAQRKRIE